MTDISGGRIVVTVEGKDIGLSQLLQKLETGMARGAAQARTYQAALTSLDPVQARLNAQGAAYQMSVARTALAMKDYAGAARILGTALQRDIVPGTIAANNAQQLLQKTLDRQGAAAQAAQAPLSGLAKGLQGMIGAYFAVTTAAQLFSQAISSANLLEKTQATFRALSGSQEEYNKNLAIAKSQQEAFGGSLQENLEGLSGFVNLSKRTGIELDKLGNIARRLAIIDPAQNVPLYSNM